MTATPRRADHVTHPVGRANSRSRATPVSSRPSDELADLVELAAAGDQDAFASLYTVTAPRVYGLALKVLRDPDHAAEVAQETYLELWRKGARFDGERGSAIAWIMRLVHSRAVDRVRAERTRQGREDVYHREKVPQFAMMRDGVHELVAASFEARRVRAALADLAPHVREAIELAYLGGYTYSEVAKVLDVPSGTAKSRIRSGLHQLRDSLGVTAS